MAPSFRRRNTDGDCANHSPEASVISCARQFNALGLIALLPLLAASCNPAPRIDLAEEIARASGVRDAMVIGVDPENPEPSPTSAPNRLTRARALRLTLEHDPRIQAAFARVRAAEADAQQARLLPNPILNVDVRFPEGGGTQVFEATLTGDLIAILSMPGHVRSADDRLRASAADALSTALDVIAEVLKSYASAQSVDAEIAVLSRRDEIARQLRDVANGRLNAGEGTRLDLLTLDAQRTQLEIDLADKLLERIQQRLALARLIGRPRDDAEWTLEPWEQPRLLHTPESAWIQTALENRPEVQSRAWELRALGEEVKLATLEPFQGGEVGAHGERDGSWAIGPTVTTPLPIFDFGQAARAKAEAQRQAAHHELAQQTNETIENVRSAYAAYLVFKGSLEAAQSRLLPLQEQQRAQAELAYRNGEADLTTLLIAENDLQETRSKLIEMQQKLTESVIQLQRAAGGAGIAAALEEAHPATLPSATQPSSIPGMTP
jgi:outer membrane protein TolC